MTSPVTAPPDITPPIARPAFVLMAVLFVGFLGWRTATLGTFSLQYEEVLRLETSGQSNLGQVIASTRGEQRPLIDMLYWFWQKPRSTEFLTRWPIALMSLTLFLPAALLLRDFIQRDEPNTETPANTKATRTNLLLLLSGLLLVSNPLLFVESQTISPVVLSLLLTTSSAFFMAGWLRFQRWWMWSMAAIFGLLALASSDQAMFALVGLLAGSLLYGLINPSKSRLKGLGGVAGWAFIFAPLIAIRSSQLLALYPSGPSYPFQRTGLVWWALGDSLMGVEHEFLLRWPLITIEVVFLLLGLVAVLKPEHRTSPTGLLLVGWLLGGLLFQLVFYARWNHLLSPIELAIYIVPLCLLQAIGFVESDFFNPRADPKSWSTPPVFALLVLLVAGFPMRRAVEISIDLEGKAPYREAAEELRGKSDETLALVDHYATNRVVSYYLHRWRELSPTRMIFDPTSSVQAMKVFIAGDVSVCPVLYPRVYPSRAFIRLMNVAKLGKMLPTAVLGYYQADPDLAQLPPDGRIAMGPESEPYLMRGWYQPEGWGSPMLRWCRSNAIFGFTIPEYSDGQIATLRVRLFPQKATNQPKRRFGLYLNEEFVAETTIDPHTFSIVEFDFPLKDDFLLFQFQSKDKLDIPLEEARSLSFAVDWIELELHSEAETSNGTTSGDTAPNDTATTGTLPIDGSS
jgi:hypothetical protein